MLDTGQVLADRFRLEKLIDEGGASTIWAATDTASERRVALKLLNDTIPDMAQRIGSFVSAGRKASKAPHEAFVTVTAVSHTEQGIPFLVMDLLEDLTSLRQILDQGEPLDVNRALMVMGAVLEALAAAHGTLWAHGDLKPENILLSSSEGDQRPLRILNLGLSRAMLASAEATTPSHISGVLDYVAPEWLQHPGADPTPTSDIFSCGVILGEMIMGQLPLAPLKAADPTIETKLADRNAYYMSGHSVPLPSTTFHDLSPQLLAVLRDATAVDPAKRFTEAGQMLRALQNVMDATPKMMTESKAFLQAETIISDPPFDLEEFRANHPPPTHSAEPTDQRETVILPPEVSTVESTDEPDTVELSSGSGEVATRQPNNPLGDPFQTNEPDIIDLVPSDGDVLSEDIKTETYRSPKPPMSLRTELSEEEGLSDVKTEVFEPAEASKDGLEQAPTMLIDPPPPVEEVSSPQSPPPPWLQQPDSRSPDESASKKPHGESANKPTGTSRFGLFVVFAALFGLVGLALLALVLWVW